MLRTPEGKIVGGVVMLLFAGWITFGLDHGFTLVPMLAVVLGLVAIAVGVQKLR